MELSCTEEHNNSKLLVHLLEDKDAQIKTLQSQNQQLVREATYAQAQLKTEKLDIESVAEGLWMLESELTRKFAASESELTRRFVASEEESQRHLGELERSVGGILSLVDLSLSMVHSQQRQAQAHRTAVNEGTRAGGGGGGGGEGGGGGGGGGGDNERLALAGDDSRELLRCQAERDALAADKVDLQDQLAAMQAHQLIRNAGVVGVCTFVCAHVRVCTRACVRVRSRYCVCVCARACVRARARVCLCVFSKPSVGVKNHQRRRWRWSRSARLLVLGVCGRCVCVSVCMCECVRVRARVDGGGAGAEVRVSVERV